MYQAYLTIDELEHKILREPEELRLVNFYQFFRIISLFDQVQVSLTSKPSLKSKKNRSFKIFKFCILFT